MRGEHALGADAELWDSPERLSALVQTVAGAWDSSGRVWRDASQVEMIVRALDDAIFTLNGIPAEELPEPPQEKDFRDILSTALSDLQAVAKSDVSKATRRKGLAYAKSSLIRARESLDSFKDEVARHHEIRPAVLRGFANRAAKGE